MYQHSHSALVIMCLSQLLDQASNKLNFVRSLSPGTLTVHLGIFCFWKMTSYETCSGWISKSIFWEAYLVQKVTVTVSSCFGLVTFGFCTLVLECKFLVFAVFPKYFYKNTRHFYNNKAFLWDGSGASRLWDEKPWVRAGEPVLTVLRFGSEWRLSLRRRSAEVEHGWKGEWR